MGTVTTYAWQGTFGPTGNTPLVFETSFGNATFLGGAAAKNIATFEQWIHSVTSGNSQDIFTFENGAHKVSTGGGADTVTANGWIFELDTGSGKDIVTLNAGAHMVSLGSGNDEADIGGFVHELNAGSGNDIVDFLGNAGANTVHLGNAAAGGQDTLTTGGWINEIIQGNGTAAVSLTAGANMVSLGGGADQLVSLGWVNQANLGSGNDTAKLLGGGNVSGGSGHDTFEIGAKSTQMSGDGGNDELIFDFNAQSRNEWDRFDGGSGNKDQLTINIDPSFIGTLIDLDAALAELNAFNGGPQYLAFLNLSIENVEIIEVNVGADPPSSSDHPAGMPFEGARPRGRLLASVRRRPEGHRGHGQRGRFGTPGTVTAVRPALVRHGPGQASRTPVEQPALPSAARRR